MSVSYNAYVVKGYKCEKVSVLKTRIKYNENTGEPYTVQDVSGHRLSIEGHNIDWHEEVYEGEEYNGLTLYSVCRDSMLVGIELGSVCDWQECIAEIEPVDESPLKELSDKFGEPSMFLVMSTA